jgi:hypothetical protein
VRLAYGETARSFFGGALDRRHRVPVAELAYTYGREGAQATGPAYHRWALAVYQTTLVRRMGRLSWRVEAGRVTAGAPLARLFTLNQPGQAGFSFLAVSNTFQILPDTLFLADRFVNAYLSQEIGPVFYRAKWSAPVLSVLQNFAWGSLRFPERHRLGFRTAFRPHFESGLQLDNLLKVNYINVAHLGVGAAVFYRWGGLESRNWRENTAVRLTLSLGL